MDTQGALELAGRVNDALAAEGVMPLVIGAVALAAHGYVRGTEDVDLGVAVAPQTLTQLAGALRARLLQAQVEVSLPDGNDPLGGVINVTQSGDEGSALVQVVNFDNSPGGGFPALIREATSLPFTFLGGQQGRLVSLEYLILSKLCGREQSRGDIEELLVRRKVDLDLLRSLAEKYGLEKELSRVLDRSHE